MEVELTDHLGLRAASGAGEWQREDQERSMSKTLITEQGEVQISLVCAATSVAFEIVRSLQLARGALRDASV
jgi:hypothetical protein